MSHVYIQSVGRKPFSILRHGNAVTAFYTEFDWFQRRNNQRTGPSNGLKCLKEHLIMIPVTQLFLNRNAYFVPQQAPLRETGAAELRTRILRVCTTMPRIRLHH